MGRLWQTVILAKWNEIFTWLPVKTIIHRNQSKDYAALRQADKACDSQIFIEFVLQSTLTAINEYYFTDNTATLSSEALRVYNLVCNHLQNNSFITVNEAATLACKSSSTLIRYFIKYLELDLVESSGANKNRRYFRKN